MNEVYHEFLLQRKKSLVGIIVTIILSLSAVGVLIWFSLLGIILAAILGYIAYRVYISSDIEYEYLYLDKELTVDKVMAKRKRKRLMVYKLDKMEIVAQIGSSKLDEYKRRSTNYKTKDYSSGYENTENKKYGIYYDGEYKVIIEAPEEFMKAMYNQAPRKVFL